jgi:hypothetical protein
LAEYNAISEEIRRTPSEALNRLNFFITRTSGVLGGIALLYQFGPTSIELLKLFSVGALILLILIGLDTFRYLIARDINSDSHVRATARIRRFFADQHPPVEQYLTWQLHDEPTKWVRKNSSGARSTTQSVISVLCALVTGLVASLFSNMLLLSIIITVAGFVVSLLVLHQYAKRNFEQAANAAKQSVRFPTRYPKSNKAMSIVDKQKVS